MNQDCDFLEHERIMDYSLLIGIHFREISQSGEPLNTKTNYAANGGKTSEEEAAPKTDLILFDTNR